MSPHSSNLAWKVDATRNYVRLKAKRLIAHFRAEDNENHLLETGPVLGPNHLGRFANESQMPAWLKRQLETKGQIAKDGMIDALRLLLDENEATLCAYLCKPKVQRVTKLKHEGGFCGYRNIQMLASSITVAGDRQSLFDKSMSTVLQIQNLIEDAWDRGYSPRGRIETGGIKGTRKYIGTPEAKTLFSSLGISCSVLLLRSTQDKSAISGVLEAIEDYFRWQPAEQHSSKLGKKTSVTSLSPVFLQRPGHSMTVIGLEKTRSGDTNLLVFDPSRQYPDHVTDNCLLDELAKIENLVPYRLTTESMLNYGELELLFIYEK